LPINIDSLPEARRISLGVPEENLYRLGPFLCGKSPHTHIGDSAWAIDFIVPEGTEVLAACDGEVVAIEDSFNEWGLTPDFAQKTNYITVLHARDEYTQYCHLAPASIQKKGLKIGDRVKEGQVIANVGKTGYMDREHLHFVVCRKDNSCATGGYSVQARFK
jgi:murein DD-endopeptidase MepM/ murein hydrolase activator NlpD